METKICNKCGNKKEIIEFKKDTRNNDGYGRICKKCHNIESKLYREKNRKEILEKQKEHYHKNIEKSREKSRFYYQKNPETKKKYVDKNRSIINKQVSKWKKENLEKVSEYSKKSYRKNIEHKKEYINKNRQEINKRNTRWRKNNKEKIQKLGKKYREEHKEYIKNYNLQNKEKINEQKRIKRNKRLINDPLYKLTRNIRCRIYMFFKKRNITKRNKTFEIVGCTPQELRNHIENQFTEGMNWNNYGVYGWHVDHRIPLDAGKNEEEIYKLCHHKNLQPLWANENLKKSNKIL